MTRPDRPHCDSRILHTLNEGCELCNATDHHSDPSSDQVSSDERAWWGNLPMTRAQLLRSAFKHLPVFSDRDEDEDK